MTKMLRPTGLRALTWALSMVLLATAASAAVRTPIADFSTGAAGAEWTPLAGDYDHLVLTVSGPGGAYLRQEFPSGMYPSFGLFDEAGAAMPDGLYKWELTLIPNVDSSMSARMAEARAAGQDGLEVLAPERSRQTGFFSIAEGSFVSTDVAEPDPAAASGSGESRTSIPGDPQGLVLSISDGVIRNSLCVGFDCPNSPTFSDSTILMMENNTRIKFGDTSSTASFPRNDWEIEANSNVNGGANYLGFNDCGTSDNDGGCATDLVFAVEAGARSSALYVESDGDVGIGTSNPVVDLHVVRRRHPDPAPGAGRLERLRAADLGRRRQRDELLHPRRDERLDLAVPDLPRRVLAGARHRRRQRRRHRRGYQPDASLHVRRTDGSAQIHIEDTSAGNQQMMLLEKTTNAPFVRFTSQFGDWDFLAGNSFIITRSQHRQQRVRCSAGPAT